MYFFPFTDILTIFIAASAGSYILAKNSSSRLNQVYFLINLFIAYTAFCEFFYVASPSFHLANIWQKISFVWPFLPFLYLKFIMVLAGDKLNKNKTVNLSLFIPAIFISALHILTGLLYRGAVYTDYGWEFIPAQNIFSAAIIIYFLICQILALIILFKYYSAQKNRAEKIQALWIFAGFLLSLLSAFISKAVLPALGYKTPPINSLSFVIGTVFIAIGILKYRFRFENDEKKRIEQALKESEMNFRHLFENSPIGIYRTTPTGQILLANPAVVNMLKYKDFNELEKRNLEQEGYQEHEYAREEFKKKLKVREKYPVSKANGLHRTGR